MATGSPLACQQEDVVSARQSSAVQDFILTFNSCESPKQALRLIKDISKVYTASICSHEGLLEVCCSSLSGMIIDQGSFPIEANLADLKDKFAAAVARLQRDDEIFTTGVTFMTDDGIELEEIALLKDHSRLTMKASLSPDDVGRLMYQGGNTVSVELLGQCLGYHSDFWKEVALSYPKNFSCFAGMDVVAAIRAYLWRFRLPGEAAQIERIVDGFARSYFLHNSNQASKEVIESEVESGEEEEVPESRRSCWDATARGWYVRQPLSGPKLLPCCAHCGALDGQEGGDLVACQGCNVVSFCRRCRRNASRYGHAVVGMIGYGRACVAAKSAVGSGGPLREITYQRNMHGARETAVVSDECLNWEPVSPFQTEDSVMILAYAIIMLTTNLHSSRVKDKMQKHEFIKQNRGVNGESNFPGDFLSKVYDDILKEELKVMRSVD